MAIDSVILTPKAGAGNPIITGDFKGAFMKKALSGGSPVNQTIPNNQIPYPIITFNEAKYDTHNFWNYSRNCFVIPKGISKIQLTGQVIILTNATGLRQLLVQRSDPGTNFFKFFDEVPIHNTPAVTGTTTDISINSPWFDVIEGQGFALFPLQASGGNLDISGATGTFFALEAQ